ncbi:MAG: DUF4278 domain-containing protein [Thainema sp.]
MIFLELLAIAIGVAVAGTLMVVGLVEAPWPVLLVLLLAGLYSLQRLSTQNEALVNMMAKPTVEKTAPEPTEHQAKKLDSTKLNQVVAKQVDMRSQDQIAAVASQDTEADLKYRGVSYHHEQSALEASSQTANQQNGDSSTPVKGKYRGRDWQRLTVFADESQIRPTVRYRGHRVASFNRSDPSDSSSTESKS